MAWRGETGRDGAGLQRQMMDGMGALAPAWGCPGKGGSHAQTIKMAYALVSVILSACTWRGRRPQRRPQPAGMQQAPRIHRISEDALSTEERPQGYPGGYHPARRPLPPHPQAGTGRVHLSIDVLAGLAALPGGSYSGQNTKSNANHRIISKICGKATTKL